MSDYYAMTIVIISVDGRFNNNIKFLFKSKYILFDSYNQCAADSDPNDKDNASRPFILPMMIPAGTSYWLL
jgi:hypothetical protein